jgi:predicted DNA-binding transcriptional regulator AlpA
MHDEADALLDTDAAARFLSVTRSFLNKARSCGGGPKFVKIGRLTRYRPADLRAFVEARTLERIAPRRRVQGVAPVGGERLLREGA